jgi:hypothetical protein
MRTCVDCGLAKPETDFYRRIGKNKTYRYRTCGKCYRKKNQAKTNAAQKRYRATGAMQAFFVKNNAKVSDGKKGREFDLDMEFVKDMISNPCTYCGRSTKFMGLDRIDNSIGHVKTNVNPCCRRCNLIRNSMPYEAWKVVATAVKKASDQGLFGDWEGQTYRGKKKCP